MNLQSEKLARAAQARSIKREQPSLGTHYWFYPAIEKPTSSIILIHGYRGNHLGLSSIAGALIDFDVYIPDLPGFGLSAELTSEHTIEAYSEWLSRFIAALNLPEKPILLGHSFGSIVVSHHAANADDFSLLILENPVSAPALKGPKAAMTLLAKTFFKFAEQTSEKTGNRILKSWPMVRGMSIVMTKSRNRKLRSWVHQQHDTNFNDFASRRVAVEGYRASISSCVADFAARFKTPVLVIAGDKDDITSVAQQRSMFSLIQSPKKLQIISGVGHLTHYECPQLVADYISSFARESGRL